MVIDTNAGGVGPNRLNTATQGAGKASRAETSVSDNGAKTSPSSTDSVSLSGTAQAMSRLESKIQSSPEVDMEKVEQIKQSINEGNYSPDPEVIASKLLEDF